MRGRRCSCLCFQSFHVGFVFGASKIAKLHGSHLPQADDDDLPAPRLLHPLLSQANSENVLSQPQCISYELCCNLVCSGTAAAPLSMSARTQELKVALFKQALLLFFF
ncbi:hypothetical protein CEXT_141851 [Caerostris extrusa]|uniref:Uncharacterized protein n=1 Tax=Caerostris extrusa TaxID=172846 RepID=A0AAV4XDE8_CAEEX|nr:hypothetical protein CEXT_141851 [Caerostris extrusa]